VVDVVGSPVNEISGATRGLHRNVEHGMHESETFLMNEETARILTLKEIVARR
jgi:hypothetical protein